MDAFISEDSPLAAYLEGKGEATVDEQMLADERPYTPPNKPAHTPPSYAPRAFSSATTCHSRATSLLQKRPIARMRNAYAYAVASTLGSTDNERFLEHFRYILIASQLLNDHVAPSAIEKNAATQAPIPTEYGPAAVSLWGAAITAAVAFALVWILNWARSEDKLFSKSRLLIVCGVFAIAGLLFYGYIRRQWLQHLRAQALSSASDFVTNSQGFEISSAATLTMVQEVELVSRGYRISSPLPPISRLDTSGQTRRCSRLRRNILTAYGEVLPVYAEMSQSLRPYARIDDLERLLDVYDVREDDIAAALVPPATTDHEDQESLKHLRVQQARLFTLRRLLLCTLLSIPATGRKEDALRWRSAVQTMERLGAVVGKAGGELAQLLQDERNAVQDRSPPSPSTPQTPISKARQQSQARRIAQLSLGIRSVEARLYLFRDDSTRALSSSTSEAELLNLSTSLKDQYDAIGSDLRTLMQAWEAGRQTLVEDITKQERRVSRASSGFRSSRTSMGGLTAVEEDDQASFGSLSPRSTAFQKLTGDRPMSPPITESEDEGNNSKDDEVFEAVAKPLPRQRSTLTREERIKKMHEDRERQATVREKRDASLNMINELRAVINLRPSKTQRRNTVTGPTG